MTNHTTDTATATAAETARNLSGRAAKAGKEITDFVKTEGKEVFDRVSHQAEELSQEVTALTGEGVSLIRARVVQQPLAAIGIAAAAGAVLALLLSRR